jgi:hypothetical protein
MADGHMIEPLDDLHRECIQARMEIRERFNAVWAAAVVWEPRPCPADWSPHGD